jgi:hypothetical protein
MSVAAPRRRAFFPGLLLNVPARVLMAALTVGMVLAGSLAGSPCRGEYAPELVLPTFPPLPPGKRMPVAPWSIAVDASGVNGNAFRGIKIRVTSNSGSVAEAHQLQVVISTNSVDGKSYDEQVTATIDVPAGAVTATAMVNVPQRQANARSVHLVFSEGGQPLRGCADSISLPGPNYWSNEERIAVLVIDRSMPTRVEYGKLVASLASAQSPLKGRYELPDVRWMFAASMSESIAEQYPSLEYVEEKYDDAQLLQALTAVDNLDFLQPAELATSWLSLSNADLIVVDWSDLQYLQSRHGPEFEALVRWAMAGGTLLVYGCGENWQHVPDLTQLVGLPPHDQSPEPAAAWKLPDASDFRESVDGMESGNSGQIVTFGEIANEAPAPKAPRLGKFGSSERVPFAYRRIGLGALVAYRAENPFPGVPADWGGLWNTLKGPQASGASRYGVSHEKVNDDFWNFLVPGVGQSPVYTFMAMIGVFMLLVGPVNYQWLKRRKRLSLLLVTAPAGAALFTLGLFAFAILSDGFGTRSRVRSFTVLEPLAQRAATMSRQTYYTAFVPSGGLRYPPDTAVFPLHYDPDQHDRGGDYYRSTSSWIDGDLRLERGYLSAREHRQFITVRSTASTAHLEVKQAGEETLYVRNRLGTPIELALLRDAEGQLYSVQNLAEDATTKAAKVESVAAMRLWTDQINPKRPNSDESFNVMRNGGMFFWSSYNWHGNMSQSNSLLERGLTDIERWLQGYATTDFARDKQSFVAITTDSLAASDGRAMAPLGIEKTEVVESLHVVQGNW